MAAMSLQVEILQLFADAQRFAARRVATEEGGLEALRRAYRDRQTAKGLCRSCPMPALPGGTECARHQFAHRQRNRDWWRANGERRNAAKRAARRRAR